MSSSDDSFIPYGRQTVSEADIAAVEAVLRGPYLTQGPAVPTFEKAVASRVSARHGVAVNSATSALHLANLALGLRSGDLLWTTPITFVASANCGRYCGANVDFVDIDPDSGLMSVKALERKLDEASVKGKLPKVLVPVHLCGTSCNMAAISELTKKYDVEVVEDASHAIGGKYMGEPVGNCRYSAITVFSFHPVKIITTAEGGLATTNSPELAQRIKDLRSHGITKEASRFEKPALGPWSYEQQDLGFNYRLSDLHAALGLSQLGRLEAILAERQRLMAVYQERLKSLPVSLLKIPENVSSALHLAVIRLHNTDSEFHRFVFDGLRAAEIGVQLHYSPVHLQPYYQRQGFRIGDFPAAEAYSRNSITLPLYPGLTEKEQDKVIDTLSSLLK